MISYQQTPLSPSISQPAATVNFKTSPLTSTPQYFFCPITEQIMNDPTMVSCGHMFDREAITGYLGNASNENLCPVCKKEIKNSTMLPCISLKEAIKEFQSAKAEMEAKNTSQSLSRVSLNGISKNDFESVKTNADDLNEVKPTVESNVTSKSGLSNATTKYNTTSSSSSKVETWAVLTPILHTFQRVAINKNQFIMGRSPKCDFTFDNSEISNNHCLIYRIERENQAGWDYFVEDKSTNGVYLNGTKIGKGKIAELKNADEICLGEKFTTKTIPRLSTFIDWVFNDITLSDERKAGCNLIKEKIISFYELLKTDVFKLQEMGVNSEFVRAKVSSAVHNWLEKYRFPGYIFETYERALTEDALKKDPHPPSEISFAEKSILEVNNAECITIQLLRSGSDRGKICVQVTAKHELSQKKFERKIFMEDQESEKSFDYKWNPKLYNSDKHSITFDAKILGGRGYVGNQRKMVLTLQNTDKAKLEQPKSPIENSSPSPISMSPLAEANVDAQDEQLRSDFLEIKRRQVAEEIIEIMVDAFPTINASEITKIVMNESAMIAPVVDKDLLKDLSAFKLASVSGVDLDPRISNIRLHQTREEEREDPIVDSNLGAGIQNFEQFEKRSIKKTAVSPADGAISNGAAPSISSAIQTLKRNELKAFTFMASLSLMRRFYSLQTSLLGVTHCKSFVVSMALDLTASFLSNIADVKPSMPATDMQYDLFDQSHIVDLFKRYVFATSEELKANMASVAKRKAIRGLPYAISLHKSANHLRMENNHSVIEDLNSLLNLKSEQQMSFYGIFDGHGGYQVSEYLSMQLGHRIANHPNFPTNIKDAIRSSYSKTDKDLLSKVARDKLRGGSTAVTSFLIGRTLITGWVGDSKCLLMYKGSNGLEAVPVTRPHHPKGNEKQRIEKRGGSVEFVAGKWRVNGRLAVSRSFGDESLKPVVSVDPDISTVKLTGNEQFLMLCCDGLYEVMEDRDIADFLDQNLKSGYDLQQLTSSLVNEGFSRGSRDDITVILVDLTGKLK